MTSVVILYRILILARIVSVLYWSNKSIYLGVRIHFEPKIKKKKSLKLQFALLELLQKLN